MHALTLNPTRTNVYATYAQEVANSKSRAARQYARNAGLHLSDESASVKEWRLQQGGGLLATGIGGPLTGQGINGLAILDDPLKNHVEAESRLIRDRTHEWFRTVFLTRLEPGASAIIVATRWHPDDLTGRLQNEGWETINLPAINNQGEALWPQRYPTERLEQIKAEVGQYTWSALYQGTPRPRGGSVYHGISTYDTLPTTPYQEAHGGDWAYTARTTADRSAVLTGRRYGDDLYLTGGVVAQEEAPAFLARLKARGITTVTSFMSGTEKALAQFFQQSGINIRIIPAQTDKFVRAQPSAARWNTKRIHLPAPESEHHGPWVDTLITEALDFTGTGDEADDTIDALAGLHHELFNTPITLPSMIINQ